MDSSRQALSMKAMTELLEEQVDQSFNPVVTFGDILMMPTLALNSSEI